LSTLRLHVARPRRVAHFATAEKIAYIEQHGLIPTSPSVDDQRTRVRRLLYGLIDGSATGVWIVPVGEDRARPIDLRFTGLDDSHRSFVAFDVCDAQLGAWAGLKTVAGQVYISCEGSLSLQGRQPTFGKLE
jgi:hypothetical protein